MYPKRESNLFHLSITRLGGILSGSPGAAPSVYGMTLFFSSTGTIITTPQREVKCNYFTATRTPGPIVELMDTFFM